MNNIPTVMILFGGSGDLAHRKIYPALFNLYRRNVIHDNFAVIGTARRPWSHELNQLTALSITALKLFISPIFQPIKVIQSLSKSKSTVFFAKIVRHTAILPPRSLTSIVTSLTLLNVKLLLASLKIIP